MAKDIKMKTIAFITRVHPKRSRMLKICIDSIKAQTSDDYIHILHRDDKTKNGYGIFLADQSLAKVFSINARYVMILDDDDMLIDPNFVEIFREIVNKDNLEIVFFKSIITGKGIYPRSPRRARNRKVPHRRCIASFCFAIRLDIWERYIHEFGNKRNGDYKFISACYKNTKNHFWLDRKVAMTQKGAGDGLGEHKLEK